MTAKQIAQQIKDSGLTIEQIQAEMERPVRIEDLLVQHTSGWVATSSGEVHYYSGEVIINRHRVSPNELSAQRAAKARLQRDRLEAYVAQENPDWDGVTDAATIYIDRCMGWNEIEIVNIVNIGAIKMPLKFAKDLCNKLNNGEIEL